jgi:hypothetical protein
MRIDTGIAAPPFFGTNCQTRPIVDYSPISFASSVVFDLVALTLTLLKVGAAQLPGSRVGKQVYQDSLLYFFITTAANIIVLTIQSLGHAHDMLKPAILPLSTVLTVRLHRLQLHMRHLTASLGGDGAAGVSQPQTLPSSPGASACRAECVFRRHV